MMSSERSDSPRDLHDFDIDFRLEHLVKRDATRDGRVVWSPARWQNLVLIAFGLPFPVAFVVLIDHWKEIAAENSTIVLVLVGSLMALLVLISSAMIAAGLLHWPRLIIDHLERSMSVRRRWSGKTDASVRLDDIDHLEIDHLWNEVGGETSGTPFRVLYAVLKDGRRASIAISPSEQFIQELYGLM